jgi:hypothetical protein
MTEHKIDLDQLAKVRDDTGHSVFSPSSSSMFLACAGSLVPNLLAPDNAGKDAAYGTVGHFVTETWLNERRRPKHLVGTNMFVESGEWGFLIDIDDEMLDYARMCVDRVEFLPGEHFTERRVDFSRITPIPRQSGTSDYIIRDKHKLSVWDWKFGIREVVYAEWNSQMLLYALGALWEFDPDGEITEIEVNIVQPRIDHFDSWTISRDDLLVWAGWAKARMAEAWRIDAPRRAGQKQCRYCKVRASCAAAAKMQADLPSGIFENLDADVTADDMVAFKGDLDLDHFSSFVEFAELTTEQMAKIRLFRPSVDVWWKELDAELTRRYAAGHDISPCKVVESRSHRVFRNQEAAAQVLLNKGCDPAGVSHVEYCTPAQAEKLLRRAGVRSKDLPEVMSGLAYTPPGKPTIVSKADKRPAMVDMSEIAFGNLDDEVETGEL